MKLNEQGKNELRKKIEEQLQNVPSGQKIHLDKELLVELLFKTIVCNKQTGETVKLPVWSGSFLRKIDLSEISFDNVSWSLLTEPNPDHEWFDKDSFTAFFTWIEKHLKAGIKTIDYSNTNAKIDFTKSWEAKHGSIIIINCNFSFVDLSNNDMSKLKMIANSDLSNTKLHLSPAIISDKTSICYSVNFSNVDLSAFTINGKNLVEGLDECLFNDECNLSNTGIKVIVNSEEMASPTQDPRFPAPPINILKNSLQQMIEQGYLDGCYINGKKVLSPKEKQTIAQKKLVEYEKMKSELISATINSIQNQTDSFSKSKI